jgi:hypothetical protein
MMHPKPFTIHVPDHGKIVAFDSEFGVICVRKDTKKALEYAQKHGFPEPFIFDTSHNKLIYLGYIPQSPFRV